MNLKSTKYQDKKHNSFFAVFKIQKFLEWIFPCC